MGIMTPPPTPGKPSDSQRAIPTKSKNEGHSNNRPFQKHKHRATRCEKDQRRRAERNRKKNKRRREGDATDEGQDGGSTAKSVTEAMHREPQEQPRLYCEETLDEEALDLEVMAIHKQRYPLERVEDVPRAIISATTPTPTPTPRPNSSAICDNLTDRTSIFKHKDSSKRKDSSKHKDNSKRHKKSRTEEIPRFTSYEIPSSRSLIKEHEHKQDHSKKRHKISRDETGPSPITSNPNPGLGLDTVANITASHSNTKCSHSDQLSNLIHLSLSRSPPILNSLDHLLSLPSYQPDPNDLLLTSAYTFLGAIQNEQIDLYDRSSALESRIKDIRSTPWKMDLRQKEEIARLQKHGEVCGMLAMELMLEEEAFGDVFEHGEGKTELELEEEVEGMRGRVGDLLQEFNRRVEELGGWKE